MRKALYAVLAAGLFWAGPSFAEMDHSAMHEMMMKNGGPKPDTRVMLNIPEPMKAMQKQMMRMHMQTLADIIDALASNDMIKASIIAKERLGWSPAEEQRCGMIGDISGQKDFVALGKAVHVKADELAENARRGDREKTLSDLSQLIKNCNACHERFRH